MMLTLIIRNLLHRPLSTLLSVVLLMLSVGIISTLLLVQTQVQHKFDADLKEIDMVVGAKGSPLQLVLSAVYQVDAPTGNVPLAEVEKLRRNPFVEQLIPLAFGDSYKNFKILGTDTAYLNKYGGQLQAGQLFSQPMQALLGSAVAKATALQPGDSFVSNHGGDARGQVHAQHPYRVVGTLKPTNTVLDQLIVTNLATIWQVHGQKDHHDEPTSDAGDAATHSHHDSAPATAPITPITSPFMVVRKAGQPQNKPATAGPPDDEAPEITAALIKFRSPMGIMMLPRIINQTTNMQAAVPTLEMNRLLNLMGIGIQTMQGIAAAIMLISGFSVFIALYNRLRQRRYEHALIRSMGGSRGALLWLTLAEGWALALAGFVLGLLLSRLGLMLLNGYAGKNFHFQFGYQIISAEWVLLAVTLLVGTLAALLPAVKAFRLNISQTLAQG